MKKRMLAMLLVLALALSLMPPVAFAQDTASDQGSYFVGYAMVDINPYAEDGTIMPLGMAGYNDDTTRLANPSKLDDNANGKIDEGDGIFATCTAITDKKGTTVLMFTADLLWGYNESYGVDVLDTLLNGQEFKQYNLTKDRIFFNGSHNHFAPTMYADNNEKATENNKAYNAYLKQQFIAAARQALADRAWADMYQSADNVVDYFNRENGAKKNQPVGDLLDEMRMANNVNTLSAAYGEENYTYKDRVGTEDVFFTCVRHFKIYERQIKTNFWGEPQKDRFVADAPEYYYYAGNGTNGDWVGVGHINTIYEFDESTGKLLDGTDGTQKVVKEYRQVTRWEEATETDDGLRVVEFRFNNSDKEPIALINWRGHLPSNASLSDDSYYQVSGGMPNALRSAMAYKGYRAAFLQGQTGNVNMMFYGKNGSWVKKGEAEQNNKFGTELAQIALDIMSKAQQINEDGGEIRSVQQVYQGDHYRDIFHYIAAKKYQAEGASGRRVYYNISYYVGEDGKPLLDSNGLPTDVGAVGDPIVYPEPITITSTSLATKWANYYDHNVKRNGELYTDVTLNALTIGDDFELVSAGAEIFDHYIGEDGKDLWDTLADDYGDPFVLGITNNYTGTGYMPDKNTYHYTHSAQDPNYVEGTYESRGTRFAEGYGEAMVKELDGMLTFLQTDHPAGVTTEGECQHCGKTVTWTDLSREVTDGYLRYDHEFTSGHYYLPEGKTADLVGKLIPEGAKVCIDINGQTLNIYRSVKVLSGGELTIMDSKGEGRVDGCEMALTGGMFNIAQGAKMNIYGGYYSNVGEPYPGYSRGGIVHVEGEFTMYGGFIQGAEVNFAGGAIYIGTTAKAFFRGGTIKNGTISSGEANGKCVTVYGEVTLSGDPKIDSLFYIGKTNLDTQKLHFDGKFTGSVLADSIDNDSCIGIATEDADVSFGNVRDDNDTHDYMFHIEEDGKIYKRLATDFVAWNAETGKFIYGDYVQDANTVNPENILQNVLNTLPDGSRIVMQAKLPKGVSYQVKQNLQWELRGQNVDIDITVAQNKLLTFTDIRETGTVNEKKILGKYRIGETTEEEEDAFTYIPITEGDSTELHPVRLDIDTMYLQPNNTNAEGKAEPGLYFGHKFDGDATVKNHVKTYGIAFSLNGAPTKEDLKNEAVKIGGEESKVYRSGNVVYTKLENSENGVVFGSDEKSTSAIITGIMKEGNGAYDNAENARKEIYGVAYVQLQNGEIFLGAVRCRSLQKQVEMADEVWNTLRDSQRKALLRLSKTVTFQTAVNSWTLKNLKDPTKAQMDTENDVLRVLAIGNSHTTNATEYLCKIFMAENPGKQVQIAQLYYSGCSVDKHVQFAAKDAAEYQYLTDYYVDGKYVNKRGNRELSTLREALTAEVWDMIIVHEVNNNIGDVKTYTGTNARDMEKHINYIRKYSLNGDPQLMWNFSWSNPTSETLWKKGYPGKFKESLIEKNGGVVANVYNTLYDKMVANTKKYVMTNDAFEGQVIPTGLAFKYAREDARNPYPNDPDLLMYSDYTHADNSFGRTLAGYVWYATLMGKSTFTELKYTDGNLTENEKALLLDAVNYAIKQENKKILLP